MTNWLDCKTSPRPDAVDYLVVDTTVLSKVVDVRFGLSPMGLFETLTDPATGEFEIVGDAGPIVVARRVGPPELTFDSPRPKCSDD